MKSRYMRLLLPHRNELIQLLIIQLAHAFVRSGSEAFQDASAACIVAVVG